MKIEATRNKWKEICFYKQLKSLNCESSKTILLQKGKVPIAFFSKSFLLFLDDCKEIICLLIRLTGKLFLCKSSHEEIPDELKK